MLQISGWLFIDTIYILIYYRNYFTDLKVIAGVFLTHFSGFIISLLIRQIYKRSNYNNRSIPSILGMIFLVVLVSANIWYWLDFLISIPVTSYEVLISRITFNYYLSNIWSNSFIFFTWSALYFSINFWFDFRAQRSRTEHANQLAQAAQLQMLRYQLNPHFLFNSLNSIRALIDEDKFRAKSMITELSEFLRYSLVSKNYSDVPLTSELEAIRHYLAIEKTRYEDNLEVEFNIDREAENYPVLSFLIHPLIENAIKYGMQTSSMPLKLKVAAKVINEAVVIEICNSGRWLEPDERDNMHIKSTGIGIKNVKDRLENAFPERHKFDILKNENSVCIKIEINNRIN